MAEQAGSQAEDLDDLLGARRGDEAAARRLVARHGASMMRTAWRVLGRWGGRDGEDVVQEALIAALTTDALPTGDVGAWLRAIAVRKALDEARRRGRRAEEPLDPNDTGANEPIAADGPRARLDVLAVRQALASLAPADRAVLTLVDLEGWSMAEAARALGLTRVAAKLRASRARRKLGRLL